MNDGVERFSRTRAELVADCGRRGSLPPASPYGMPSSSAASAFEGGGSVVQQVPNPRARAASMKLQIAEDRSHSRPARRRSLRPFVRQCRGSPARGLTHVIGKVLPSDTRAAYPGSGWQPGFRRDPRWDRLQVRIPTPLVERAECLPFVWIGHDDERPTLVDCRRWGLAGQLQALLDQRRIDLGA